MNLAAIALAAAALAACGDKGEPRRPPAPGPSPAPTPVAPPGDGSALVPAVAPTGAGTIPPGTDALAAVPADVAAKVQLVEVAKGFKRPVAAVVAPGDARRRLFVVEQHRARILIVEAGATKKQPFFDLGARNVSNGNEQGLLGLAFHPDFAKNRRLYVHYTAPDDHTHVVEYQVSASDPDTVDTATAREVFFIEQPYSNHNGGHLAFGPDGKLYIGMGDGGAAGDPLRAGQDLKNLLAKILRLDVDTAGAKPEIVHYGVRNPWRYAFDAKTGDLFIGDVGQNKWEYVFVVAGDDPARKNFGWNIVEGSHCYQKRDCDKTGFTLPVVEYGHDQGCSITGGVVYRGKALSALDGAYFYADYCTSLVRSFRYYKDPSVPAGGVARDHWDWRASLDPSARLQSISSFGVDHDGEILIVTLTGGVFRLAPR